MIMVDMKSIYKIRTLYMINFLKKIALGFSSLALASLLSFVINFYLLFGLHSGAGSMDDIVIIYPLILFFFGFFMVIRIYGGDYFLEKNKLEAFKQACIDLYVAFLLLFFAWLFLLY